MKRLGEKVTFKLIDEPIYNVFGEPNGVLCFLRDITEEKKKVETILDVSYTDYLTGLRNRRYMRNLTFAFVLNCIKNSFNLRT